MFSDTYTHVYFTHTHARSPAPARFLARSLSLSLTAYLVRHRIGYGWIGAMRRAHPTACAHCRALDSPAASLRSWNCSTRDTARPARPRPAAPRRSCSCRRAHSSLHGAFDPARRRLSVIMLVRARRTVGFRGQRDGRESQYVIGILGADCAHEGLAVRKLGVTTLDVRRHSAWYLGVADDTERDKRHEDRGAAPAANQRH